jgi:hypothetical protein
MELWKKIINDIINRIEKLENNLVIKKFTIPSDGYLVPKVLSSDPVSPTANEVWINSTTKQLKWRDGGTTRAVTLT